MPPQSYLHSVQAEEFVLKTDQAPEFWQFLNGLRGDDLLVELIVNELDARSSRTEIRFEPNKLVCAGDGEAIRADTPNPRLRLAIHSVRNVRNPIADELRQWQIPVLSSVAREPVNPAGRDQEPAPVSFIESVHAMAGANAGKLFRKQLQEFDVSQNLIEPQFQRRLLAIKRVVIVSGLTVQFKVRGRQYRAAREWVVLSNEIWLDRDGDLEDLLMKAIADIVFLKPRLRWLSSVLKDALRHGTHEFRAKQELDRYEQDGYDEKPAEDEAGESSQPHPGSAPDPKRNNPNPGELYSGGGIRNTKRSSASNRKQVVAEDKDSARRR